MLSGQGFQTIKIDAKERFDPTQCQEATGTGTDVEAGERFLDAPGAKVHYWSRVHMA